MGSDPVPPESGALLEFERLDRLHAHEYVAEQLRRHIALRLVAPGQSLPAERSLAQNFGVGRATVQRALSLLEAEQLIERRRGRNGGSFVRERPAADHEARSFVEEVRTERTEIEHALDYRIEIEPAAAWHCALSAGPDDVDRIVAAAGRVQNATDEQTAGSHDAAFHLAIARATGNSFFVAGVEEARRVLTPALFALPESALWYERTAREHGAIVTAIMTRNPSDARDAMRSHLAGTDRGVRALIAAL
jgi:GntR family transcriptional repressor for pyruvate dehydrogenase complex